MILLDTCALLWLAIDPEQLSEPAREALRKHSSRLYVSAISAFEIGQKHARGKLKLKLPPKRWFGRALELHGLNELSLDSTLLLAAIALPDRHRDPFDRILIATAQARKMTLLTPDPLIRRYAGTKVLW